MSKDKVHGLEWQSGCRGNMHIGQTTKASPLSGCNDHTASNMSMAPCTSWLCSAWPRQSRSSCVGSIGMCALPPSLTQRGTNILPRLVNGGCECCKLLLVNCLLWRADAPIDCKMTTQLSFKELWLAQQRRDRFSHCSSNCLPQTFQ